MRRLLAGLTLLLLVTVGASLAADQPLTLAAAEAAQHAGEVAKVCGAVASAKFASSSRVGPTYVNLDKAHPNQVFTILISGENRATFGAPEKDYARKRICATGKIEMYRGKPEIVAREPGQGSTE